MNLRVFSSGFVGETSSSTHAGRSRLFPLGSIQIAIKVIFIDVRNDVVGDEEVDTH